MVDLGDLNLSKPGSYNYVLSSLPKAEFVIGIDVEEAGSAAINARCPDHSSGIRLSLKTANEDLVIFEESSLNDWVCSHNRIDPVSNLYRRGKSRDIEYADGSTRSKRLGVKASGGWGTYFYSERFEEYILELVVLESSQYINRPAKLVVQGWNR